MVAVVGEVCGCIIMICLSLFALFVIGCLFYGIVYAVRHREEL